MTSEQRASAVLGGITAVVLGVGLILGRSEGGPRRPTNVDEVAARVPARATDPAARELATLERTISADSKDVDGAVALARLGIETARRRSDPRYLGKAEAALRPWWDDAQPPDSVLLLRATIRQSRHEFGAALADLERLVARSDDGQAQLTRAVVLTVLGRYREALDACDALASRAGWYWGTACRAPALARSGRGREAAAALATAIASAEPHQVAWGESLLGEILYWESDPGAEGHLRRALAADPEDVYTRAVLADLLLDGGRAHEAAELVAGQEQHDALLLRAALADALRGRDGAAATTLRERFAAARRRGDELHGREEARFALTVEGDPGRALSLSLRGFSQQKEPWDLRLVLAAARAAGDPAAAAPAVTWMHRTGENAPRLVALAEAVQP